MKENHFAHRIDKAVVNTLPVVRFEGEVVVVNSREAVQEAMAYLNAQTLVGVDTETKPTFHRGEHRPTALVQIATQERCFLFQLMLIGFPPALAQFFANDKICKVGLAFKDDLHGLQSLRSFTPRNCVDLQKLVLTYGILDLGLQKMFAIVFGRKISKAQQLTNWEMPVLSIEQAYYASTDAWATLLIYQELQQTRPLPKKVYLALQQDDLQQQRLHQQEVLAARHEAESADPTTQPQK